MIEIGAAYVAILAFLIACINDPDNRRPMQNIPKSRWQWLFVELPFALFVALIVGIVMLWSLTAILAAERPHSNPWLLEWIPSTCCVTNDCCWQISASEVRPEPADHWTILSTGQTLKRTDWSPDGKFYRCACDYDAGERRWIRHQGAYTRCIFVPMQSASADPR